MGVVVELILGSGMNKNNDFLYKLFVWVVITQKRQIVFPWKLAWRVELSVSIWKGMMLPIIIPFLFFSRYHWVNYKGHCISHYFYLVVFFSYICQIWFWVFLCLFLLINKTLIKEDLRIAKTRTLFTW